MNKKQVIQTKAAPLPIGAYSQAIKVDNTVYLAGIIPLDPETATIVSTNMVAQVEQVFKNLIAIVEAAGGSLDNLVKLTVYLTDLTHFSLVNTAMTKYFTEPYPARTTIGVASLPKDAAIEIEGILVL